MRARCNDSASGRFWYARAASQFLSRDPFPGDQWWPLSLNPYAYGHGDPDNSMDPAGREAIEGGNSNNTRRECLALFGPVTAEVCLDPPPDNMVDGMDRVNRTYPSVFGCPTGISAAALAASIFLSLRDYDYEGGIDCINGVKDATSLVQDWLSGSKRLSAV